MPALSNLIFFPPGKFYLCFTLQNTPMKKQLLQVILCSTIFSATAGAQATLVSKLDFNGSLNDAQGNAITTAYNNAAFTFVNGSMVWTADTLQSGGGIMLRLPDAVFTEDDYSIAIDFQYAEVTSYRKIIDYRALGSDQGLYVNGSLRLYSGGGYGSSQWNAATNYTVLVTRSAADDTTRAYLVQGNQLLQESKVYDVAADFVAVLSGNDRVLHFFHDDTVTTAEHASAGSVSLLRIWNGIATLQDVLSGIPQAPAATPFNLYPNPALSGTADVINVQLPEISSSTAEVFDAIGSRVCSVALHQQGSFKLNTAGWAKGVYFLRVDGIYSRFVKN